MKIEKMKGGAIDWPYCYSQARKGKLRKVIEKKIPREHWKDISLHGECNLLHVACEERSEINLDAIALLLAHGVNPNQRQSPFGQVALSYTVLDKNHRATELLCAAGADAHIRGGAPYVLNDSPFQLAFNDIVGDTANVLLANGYRICSLPFSPKYCFQSHRDFERGILACRSAFAALLLVKRKHPNMAHVDRFLMREIALAVWATRSENNDAWAQVRGAEK